MQRNTKSILDELDGLLSSRDKTHLVESRATNVIASAINLITYIRENFDEEQSLDLERRLLNSIKSQDPQKFIRGIKRLK